MEEISSWKDPSSVQMTMVSYFFKLSMVLRNVHTILTEEYQVRDFTHFGIWWVTLTKAIWNTEILVRKKTFFVKNVPFNILVSILGVLCCICCCHNPSWWNLGSHLGLLHWYCLPTKVSFNHNIFWIWVLSNYIL